MLVTLKRDSFLTKTTEAAPAKPIILILLGLGCGIYDGAFGPGAGTFMFLSLTLFGGFSLISALATSKLANTLSAGFSLLSFSYDGAVNWSVGLSLMPFCVVGAIIGSYLANKKLKEIVRPILAIIVILLMLKILFMD